MATFANSNFTEGFLLYLREARTMTKTDFGLSMK